MKQSIENEKNRAELALLLNYRTYGNEITDVEVQEAAKQGLIIIYGASDDLVEIRGVIHSEVDCFEGVDFMIATPGTIVGYTDPDIPDHKVDELTVVALEDVHDQRNLFEAKWNPEEADCSWFISSKVPHSAFDIMEDGELYCRGMVICISDLEE